MKDNNKDIKELIDWVKKYKPNFEYTIKIIDNKDYVVCNILYLSYNKITELPTSIGNLKCDLLNLAHNNIKNEDIKWLHTIGLKWCHTDYSNHLNENILLSKINSRKHIIDNLLDNIDKEKL